MATESQPQEAKTINELLELITNESTRIRYTLYQPHLVPEMKTNIIKISDTLKYSIDKAAMLTHQQITGINELCPEISKYISILTISVKIINYGLCECAANQLIKACIKLFTSIHKLFIFIQNNTNKNDDSKTETKTNNNNNNNNNNSSSDMNTLTTLVGVIWEDLKYLKTVPLNNTTSIGKQILKTLTIIRDAKKEIKQSIKDMEINECIIKLNPWKYDYSKLALQQNNQIQTDNKQEEIIEIKNNDDDDYDDDDDDMLFIGMSDNELNELESLRVYQIYECIMFVDEVINHIYLFIIKHFKENINDFERQKLWLTKLTNSIELLPKYVDELSCCIYDMPMDNKICKNASNLLYFLWNIAIDISEESIQYKNRKMVIKNKKKKSKYAINGYEWKCKFVDLNIKIGQMFGILNLDYVDKFIKNDENYNKNKKKKKDKKNNKKNKRKDKMRKYKKNKSKNKKKNRNSHSEVSASSQKELESNTQTDNTSQTEINHDTNNHMQGNNNEDMIDID